MKYGFKACTYVVCTVVIAVCVIIACIGSYRSHNYSMQVRPPEVVPERFSSVEYVEVKPIEPIEIYVPSEVPFVRTSEFVNLTFEEMDLLQQIAMAESGNQDEIGQALVMLTVLNRSEINGQSIRQVIYAEGQFTTVPSPMFGHYIPNENCNKALAMILDGWDEKDFDSEWDVNEKVYYFGANGYSAYGNIGFKYGGHYFNTRSVA